MVHEIHLRIIRVLIFEDRPMTLSEIANASCIPKQKVAYHLPLMIDEGIILPLDGVYMAQPLFSEHAELLEYLKPLVYRVRDEIDADSATSLDDAIVNFLTVFMRIISLEETETEEPE